jgi:hypothetical protein
MFTMTTLGDYLRGSPGAFSSPNHPVPMNGEAFIHLLNEGPVLLSDSPEDRIDIIDMPIEIEEQPSGDRWIYALDAGTRSGNAPYLIHHPEISLEASAEDRSR